MVNTVNILPVFSLAESLVCLVEISPLKVDFNYEKNHYAAVCQFRTCCAAQILLLLWRTCTDHLHYYIAHYNSQCHIERININGVKPATGDGASQTAKSLL